MVGDALFTAVFYRSGAVDADRGPRRGGPAARLRELGGRNGQNRDRGTRGLLRVASLSLSASLRLERANLLVQLERRVAGGKDDALLRLARGDSQGLRLSLGAPGRNVGLVVACRSLFALGRTKRAAHPQRPHEGAEPGALCLGARHRAGALLFTGLRVSRAGRLSRVGVCVGARGGVLGAEDGRGEFSQVFVRTRESEG